jgi:hypothetical protein
MENASPSPQESISAKAAKLVHSAIALFGGAIRSVYELFQSQTIKVWHWSAKWRWFDGILGVGFAVSLGIHEYWIAIVCLILCAFSGISIVWHETKHGRLFKSMWTVFICGALGYLIFVTVQEKEDHPWSHLSKPIQLIFQRPPQMECPNCYVPTPENWAAKQHFQTGVLVPSEGSVGNSRPRQKPTIDYHPVLSVSKTEVECKANGERLEFVILITLHNPTSFETKAHIQVTITWDGVKLLPDIPSRDIGFAPGDEHGVRVFPYLLQDAGKQFLDGTTKELFIKLSVEYPDRDGKTVYEFEGVALKGWQMLDIRKSEWH